MTDDCRGRPARTIKSSSSRGSQTLNKLDLANRAQLEGSIGTVHGSRLDEHGGTHVVAAVHVGSQLIQQITLVGNALGAKIPEVMMRITDRDLRLQSRFLGQ